jgi:peptidoglycan/LPS O-acetylase OafA/YrhL
MKTEKNRLDYIDALRGIAILGVFVCHAAGGAGADIRNRLGGIASCGQYGVQLFFVISAFTILLSLDRREAHDRHLYANFFIRRLFRIVPVYWFGIALYTILYGLKSRTILPGPEPWHYILHATLTNVLHPSTLSSVVPGGWSISLEVLFYLSIPFLFTLITTLKRAVIITSISVVFFPFLNLILSKTVGPFIRVDEPILNDLFWYRFPLNQIGAFSFGFLLFFLLKEQRLKEILSDRILNGVLFTSLIASSAFLTLSHIELPPKHLVFSLLFCLIALLLACLPWKIIVNPLFRFFGRISYSCYLLHFLVLIKLQNIQSKYNLFIENDNLRFLAYLTLTTILTVPLAWLSFKLIENPSISWGRIVSKRWANKTVVDNRLPAPSRNDPPDYNH